MNWKSKVRVTVIGVALVMLFMIIPAGYVAAEPIVDPIQIDSGLISGTMLDAIKPTWLDFRDNVHTAEIYVGTIGEPVRIYRGIPYAVPPVGELRWKPPQPVEPWENVRECTTFCKMAPQTPFPQSFFWDHVPESGMSEDCLYLNVVTPAQNTDDRLPVIVFFHGGGLYSGSNSYDSYNAPAMPQHGVVWVSVQHRLGVFGFMAHPELTAESPNNASGNYGMLDLIAALEWVQRNIAAFGGNPDCVTIKGQSGGGSKVNGLMASPLSAGLFHRAICQSGGWKGLVRPDYYPLGTPLAEAEQYGVNLQTKLGAANLAEMRAMTWQEIVTAAAASDSGWVVGMTADGWFLTDSIWNTFLAGNEHDVPYMVGVAGEEIKEEGATSFYSAEFIMFELGNILRTMSSNRQSPIYTYVFTHVPDGWKEYTNAWHGIDISYGFGTYESVTRFPAAIITYSLLFVDPEIGPKDAWVSEYWQTMEAQFAATGNPNYGILTDYWPAYDERDFYLDIGYLPITKAGFSSLTEKQPAHSW